MTDTRPPFSDREAPRSLQDRVERTLMAGGLLESRSSRLQRYALRAAVLVIVAGAAFVVGRARRELERPDSLPQFLMLLYEDSAYRDDRPVREIVAEYASWADSLRQQQALVLGEKLDDARAELPLPAAPRTQSPTGMFILRASSLQHATTLAASSPHLRYGGRVVIHQIDR